MDIRGRLQSVLSSTDSLTDPGSDSDSGTNVVAGEYTWDDYCEEFNVGLDAESPDPKHNDLTPGNIKYTFAKASDIAEEVNERVEKNTVDIADGFDEDEFFTNADGEPTVVTRYDLEKAVDPDKKTHFVELERYWVNKPFAFVILFRSSKENEIKYFVIEPFMNMEETRILDFMKNKLQDTIKFSDEAKRGDTTNAERAALLEQEAYKLMYRYDLIVDTPFSSDSDESASGDGGLAEKFGMGSDSDEDEGESDKDSVDEKIEANQPDDDSGGWFSRDKTSKSIVDKLAEAEEEEAHQDAKPVHVYTQPEVLDGISGSRARPENAVIESGAGKLTDHQVLKILYYLKRDSVSYGPIDPIKHDINIEDVSCDGYNSRVFVYHGEHEQIISNVRHGKQDLDDFVINLAQRSGKGISKRQPQVDATLPDGSRSQLTLGAEVSDHGTNYTIRQFQEIPHTPIDLMCWKTFAPDQMAFMWLAIENHKSLIYAGGTASGKTTSLNASSLFIPSGAKIVSIEDTREVELPQRNWVASVTRPSFTEDGVGDVDEFALLEAALRQRPDYIVMGEIRGEEGRTLFQVMSTGHTTYTTFHADSVGEVIKRFTTDPINVSKTLFTALDLVSIQTSTRVNGHKVRRNKVLTEINDYSSESDEINVNDIYQWIAEDDAFEKTEDSEILDTIMFDRGWDKERLELELSKREVVLAYLIHERLNTYTQVAASIQAFINEPDVILDLIANDQLEESLTDLREMESVMIDIDPEKEDMVPRPEPADSVAEWVEEVLSTAVAPGGVLHDRIGDEPDADVGDVLSGEGDVEDVTVEPPDLDGDGPKALEGVVEDEKTSDDDMGGFVVDGIDEEPPQPELEGDDSSGTADASLEGYLPDTPSDDTGDSDGDGKPALDAPVDDDTDRNDTDDEDNGDETESFGNGYTTDSSFDDDQDDKDSNVGGDDDES